MNDDINEKYGVSYDVRENLFKAQTILKKSTVSISAARASISKTDKTFMCDKNYVNFSFHYYKYNSRYYKTIFASLSLIEINN